MRKVSKKTGRAYCFQPDRLCVQIGNPVALIGDRQYRLLRAATVQGDDWFLAVEDVRRLLDLSSDIPVEIPSDAAVDLDGVPSIGIRSVLSARPELKTCMAGDILVIALDGSEPEIKPPEKRILSWKMGEKHVGELFRAEWCPELERVNSYRLYVPSSWTTLKRRKMMVWLHGASGNEDNAFERSAGELSYLAEQYGYLIFAPNSFVARSNFGGSVPPSGQFAAPLFIDADGKSQYYSTQDLEENTAAQVSLMRLMEQVVKEFGVDSDAVFLMGNSMGGIGTFHLGLEFRDYFRALIPCGALPEPRQVDWSSYGNKPILYIAGTEDHNGYEQMVRDYTWIAEQGVSMQMLTVGGGKHADAWVKELKAAFEFCESNL